MSSWRLLTKRSWILKNSTLLTDLYPNLAHSSSGRLPVNLLDKNGFAPYNFLHAICKKKLEEKTSLGEQNTEKLYSGLVSDSKVISIISNFIIFHVGGMKKRKRDTKNFDLVCYITRIDLISMGFCGIIFTYRRHRGFPPWLCLHTSRNTSSPLAQFPASRSKRQTTDESP